MLNAVRFYIRSPCRTSYGIPWLPIASSFRQAFFGPFVVLAAFPLRLTSMTLQRGHAGVKDDAMTIKPATGSHFVLFLVAPLPKQFLQRDRGRSRFFVEFLSSGQRLISL